MEITTFKCPCCDAGLKFDSEQQTVACEYCGNTFTLDQLRDIDDYNSVSDESVFDWNDEAHTKETVDTENMCVYSCPSCGAEIVGAENMAATECAYCTNPVIVSEKLSGMLKPDLIIPFSVSKDEAKAAYKNFIKGKKLLPNLFAEENRIEKMTGIYVPFWLFDCNSDGTFSYTASNTRVWSDSKYRYTKTDYYSVIREGRLSFLKVPVDASVKMADEYMDALEPYNYNELKDFDMSYISGYYADRYDTAAMDSRERASRRIRESTENIIRGTVNGYSSVIKKHGNVNTSVESTKYALLPVWILNTKYKDTIYTFAVNGQTGKFVGELPVDKKKYYKWLFGVTAAVFAVSQLLLFFM